jgi:hypothetical protein
MQNPPNPLGFFKDLIPKNMQGMWGPVIDQLGGVKNWQAQGQGRADMLQEMEMAMAGPAHVGKIQDAWAQIQTGGAFTPFEQRMLEMWVDVMTQMRQQGIPVNVKRVGP